MPLGCQGVDRRSVHLVGEINNRKNRNCCSHRPEEDSPETVSQFHKMLVDIALLQVRVGKTSLLRNQRRILLER